MPARQAQGELLRAMLAVPAAVASVPQLMLADVLAVRARQRQDAAAAVGGARHAQRRAVEVDWGEPCAHGACGGGGGLGAGGDARTVEITRGRFDDVARGGTGARAAMTLARGCPHGRRRRRASGRGRLGRRRRRLVDRGGGGRRGRRRRRGAPVARVFEDGGKRNQPCSTSCSPARGLPERQRRSELNDEEGADPHPRRMASATRATASASRGCWARCATSQIKARLSASRRGETRRDTNGSAPKLARGKRVNTFEYEGLSSIT